MDSRIEDFSCQVRKVVQNARRYHSDFIKARRFTGPSLYFHRRAVATAGGRHMEKHLEYVYAAVTSWGMHRMGPKGAKMVDFDEFRQSVIHLKPVLDAARELTLSHVEEMDWPLVERIFRGINVMKSGPVLVGNSKVMAHMLPHLAPPIDRAYTLLFLRGTTYVPRGIEGQWQLMKSILGGFFVPVARDRCFAALARDWIRGKSACRWDTSVPKIIDNLVVGAVAGRRELERDA